MKKVLLGIALGSLAGYLFARKNQKDPLEKMADELNKLNAKSRRKMKDILDSTRNQAAYIRDRAIYEMERCNERQQGLHEE